MSCSHGVGIEQPAFFLLILTNSILSISSERKPFLQYKMDGEVKIVVFLVTLLFVESQISLYNTNDGLDMEFYDCLRLQSLDYCRRPKDPINLIREKNNQSCEDNYGKVHRFSELSSRNVTFSMVLHEWKSTLEQVEQYSRYLTDPSEPNGYLCQCLQRGSFGKNCEYQLPVGQTFEETLDWQLTMRENNSEAVQIYGDVVCYETLECDSGMLCLDWRNICDGVQNCLEGKDEENCDLLEMNQCDEEEEYRCMNGMCIAEEFFLDGEFDCLDWSDEMQFKSGQKCPMESVSSECDDHLCPPNYWSCGDGQCINDRLMFQRLPNEVTCHSGRDQYFICETHLSKGQWTMENGRCLRNNQYQAMPVENTNDDDRCEYLLKCLLSTDMEMNCYCYRFHGCLDEFGRVCPLSFIQYPREAVVTPFTFYFFNRTRDLGNSQRPDLIVINGTVRCRDVLITVREKRIPFNNNWNERQMIEDHFCLPYLRNISSSNTISTDHDRCGEWKEYSSVTRLRDGWKNCLNGKDEEEQTEGEIEKSCGRVRRHRFHCSRDQPTCLSVMNLGIESENCRNRFDELFFGVGRTISSLGCHNQRQDECSLLRQYISQSSKSMTKTDNIERRSGLSFRFHCDTFSDLPGREDETLLECQQWWICLQDQRRCLSGQCFEQSWLVDNEWDCSDASDEHDLLNWITEITLEQASRYNFTNGSFFIPSNCSQSDPFLCLSLNATRQGFECFNLSQIGDGNIDCAGGQEERNTLPHCSEPLSTLGSNFLCPSTNSCIPYNLHCSRDEYRCPRRSDDQFWCDRQHRPENCDDLNDFVCFDGRCFKGGRCDAYLQCPFNEDEYMCDYSTSSSTDLINHRKWKRLSRGSRSSILRLSLYPFDLNITQSSSITSTPNPVFSSLSPYWCNRGLGILLTMNHSSIVCFCPPQYYGDKCQFHRDRLSVVLHFDLSQFISSSSMENDRNDLFKLIVRFIFNGEVLMTDQFHLYSSVQINSLLDNNNQKKNKLITHFPYPHSSPFRQQRHERFFNRSPFSIRIELYQTRLNEQPSIMAVWKYPLPFAHLPVSRLAKVLHFSPSPSPCSSQPCHRNEECHPLMNNRSEYICLCKTNFTRENCSQEDQQCLRGYCSMGSLCQPNSRSSLHGDSSPFCLCPMNRFGRRCSIEHDRCLSFPCLHDGSCFPDVRPSQVICLCTKEYFGSHCQLKRTSIHLSLSSDLRYRGVVFQILQIDLSSLQLILLQQRVFLELPPKIEYYHRDQSSITGIVLAKVYLSDQVSLADVHLLSVHEDVSSLHGRTKISLSNQCEHLRTFSKSNSSRFRSSSLRLFSSLLETSPIRYHQICITNITRLCFLDDVYLCICGENHSRVECFNYDDQLDRCEHCLNHGRCLRGNPRLANDFLCLCPSCHSGDQCQFNTKSFLFTVDQLFSSDLFSAERRRTISLLIFFPLLLFFLALPNNLFSFLTVRRGPCLRYGIGHYLLAMSVINQINLALFVARLIHLIVNISKTTSSSSVWDDVLCKSLNYFLSSSSRMVYWLTSLISIERLYTTAFINGQWLRKPHIARRLIALILINVFDQ